MLDNLLRDESTVPAVKRLFAGFRDYLTAARDTLMAGRRARGRARQRTQAAIGHALAFTTWRSLASEQELDDPAGGRPHVPPGGGVPMTARARTTPRSASPARA